MFNFNARRIITTLVLVLGAAGTAAAIQQAAATATRREPQFENENVKVWKSIIMPNQPLTLHRHEFGRTIVTLKGGTLDIVDAGGKTTKKVVGKPGKRTGWTRIPPASSTATSIAARSRSK
jgi:hypothetical protein